MYEVTVNTDKNYMLLILKGYMKDEEIKAAAAKVLSEADKLIPGFTIINDISEFKPTMPSGAEEIRKTQAAVFQKGIGKVIRIMGKSVIAGMQFSRMQKEAEALYEVIEVPSMDEALKLL